MTWGEFITIILVILGFAATTGVAFYKINCLEDEMNNRKLEIGQIKRV